MKLFFTAAVIDEDSGEVETSVHGPFKSERRRDDAVTEFREENGDDVIIILLNAEVDQDDVNLIIPD